MSTRFCPDDLLAGAMPDRARNCTTMPEDARAGGIRKNKPNLLADAATGVAEALIRNTFGLERAAGIPPVPTAGVPDRARPCTTMHDHARDSAIRKNEANLPADELSPLQLAAVRGLLAGKRVTALARELAIDPATLFRWRRLPAFVAELKRQHEGLCRELKPVTRQYAGRCATGSVRTADGVRGW